VEPYKCLEYNKPASCPSAVLKLFSLWLCSVDFSRNWAALEQDHHAWSGQGLAEEKFKCSYLLAEQPTRYAACLTATDLEPAIVWHQRLLSSLETKQQS
jgi:hypothetical protein